MRFDVAVTAKAGTPGMLRILVPLLALLLMASAGPAWARARKEKSGGYMPPFSAMVLDPVSQRVLYELDADGPRHPASLTKVMTLFILFEELEKGELRLDSPLIASWKAINQAPSRLGLQKGETILVEDAIKAVVTRSANDVAMLIAENLGGSEQGFVDRMNATAQTLGMRNTTFANPTGLPDKRQITTARDLVLLGSAIRQRFPQLFSYFSIRSFDYGGKTVLSHNKLMNRLQGMEGIKTGFINASGFNLLASVKRDRQSVVAVVLGGTTARARDTRMTELVEAYLPKAVPLDPFAGPGAELADMGFHHAQAEGGDAEPFITTGSLASGPTTGAVAARSVPASADPAGVDQIAGPVQVAGMVQVAGPAAPGARGPEGGLFGRILLFLLLAAVPPAAILAWRTLHVLVILRVVGEHVRERALELLAGAPWCRGAQSHGPFRGKNGLAQLPAPEPVPALPPARQAVPAHLAGETGLGYRWPAGAKV
jgi:D-alanyl-D-alanine carboxypeptidase